MSRFLSPVLVLIFVASVPAQNSCGTGSQYFASSIVNYTPGPGVTAGSGFGIPSRLLCVPGGTTDVLTLGVQGTVTVGFDFPVTDGPGTDFITWENGFGTAGGVFAELAFVEVSTNGVDFARFQSRCYGPTAPASLIPSGCVKNIAGIGTLVTQPTPIGYSDPAVAGGDAFDLEDLAQHPLVVSGAVNLSSINFVRLVDIQGSGSTTDSFGVPIYDTVSGSASADFDAIAVVNSTINQDPNRPAIAVTFDESTRQLTLTASDASGWMTIAGAAHFSINGIPTDLWSTVAAFFPFVTMTPTSVSVTSFPLPPGVFGTVCLSAADGTGLVGADCGAVTP